MILNQIFSAHVFFKKSHTLDYLTHHLQLSCSLYCIYLTLRLVRIIANSTELKNITSDS